jgi:hypothetical protein
VITSKLPSVEHYLPGDEKISVVHDPEYFIEALRYMNYDRNRLHTMRQAARKRAELLSWPLIASKYEFLYEKIARQFTSK